MKYSHGYILLICFLAIGLFNSCKRELDYVVPSADPKLVVNSVFTSDSTWRIEVSTSARPGNGHQIQSLDDCLVSLFENGNRIKDIVLDSSFSSNGILGDKELDVKTYFFRTDTSRVLTGHSYTVEISYPSFKTVSGTASVPFPVNLGQSVRGMNAESMTIDGTTFHKYEFSILDQSIGGGYYALQLWDCSTDGTSKRIDFFSQDDLFSENSPFHEGSRSSSNGRIFSASEGVFFSSKTFAGKERNFEIFVDSHFGGSHSTVKLKVLTLSKELFDFATGLQKQQANQNNPFAEPVHIFSNIHQGFGIFAGYSISELSFN